MIETERLRLRKPQLDDVDDVLGFVGDHEVMRWIGGEAGGREMAIQHVEKWIGLVLSVSSVNQTLSASSTVRPKRLR